MSRGQLHVLSSGLLAVLLAVGFPPWRYVGTHTHNDTYDVAAGYGFIFKPPEAAFSEGGRVPPKRLRIAAGLLLAEFVAIAGVTGLIMASLSYSGRRDVSAPRTRERTGPN